MDRITECYVNSTLLQKGLQLLYIVLFVRVVILFCMRQMQVSGYNVRWFFMIGILVWKCMLLQVSTCNVIIQCIYHLLCLLVGIIATCGWVSCCRESDGSIFISFILHLMYSEFAKVIKIRYVVNVID